MPATAEFFYRKPGTEDKLLSRCIKCICAGMKAIYLTDRDSLLAKNLAYRNANRENYNAAAAARRKANPERTKQIAKRSHDKNKERRNADSRDQWVRNKDKYKASALVRIAEMREVYNATRRKKDRANPDTNIKQKAYRLANIEKHKANARARWAKATPQVRLRTGIGAAIAHSLKGRTKGGNGWQTILGYTIHDLVKHLESKFQEGMSWENYGLFGWHVDHVKPVSMHSYEEVTDQEFLDCWAITNLQPLWAAENMAKGNRWIG